MAILGITTDRTNPPFTSVDFLIWMPQFSQFIATETGTAYFDKLYGVANQKIFKSIYGADWELAMSYCIAHYLTLIGQQMQAPSGSTLGEIAGGGVMKGVLSSASIGGFSKSYDLGLTTLNSEEAMFWNQTSYGASLMALYKTKAVASIFVVTPGPVPGAENGAPIYINCED